MNELCPQLHRYPKAVVVVRQNPPTDTVTRFQHKNLPPGAGQLTGSS